MGTRGVLTGTRGVLTGTRGVLTGTHSMQPNEDVGLRSAVHCRPRRLQQWCVPRPDFINGPTPNRVPAEYPRAPFIRRLQQWCMPRPDFIHGLTQTEYPSSTPEYPAVPRTELMGSPQPPAAPGPVRALRCLIGLPLRVCCVGTNPHTSFPRALNLHVAEGIILGYSRVP